MNELKGFQEFSESYADILMVPASFVLLLPVWSVIFCLNLNDLLLWSAPVKSSMILAVVKVVLYNIAANLCIVYFAYAISIFCTIFK